MRPNSLKSRSGQTMVEYIIIVALVAIAGLAVWRIFGGTLTKKMSGVVSELDTDNASKAQNAAQDKDIKDLTDEGFK